LRPAQTPGVRLPDPRLLRGAELQRRGSWNEAEALYREVLAERPEDAAACHHLGVWLEERGRMAEAIDWLGRAAALEPHVAPYHLTLASVHRHAGDAEAAERCWRAAIERDATCAKAYYGLARLRRYPTRDELLDRAEALLARTPALHPRKRRHLHFAAAKLYDDLGEVDRAFAHARAANRLARKPFDWGSHESLLRGSLLHYGHAALASRLGPGAPSRLPVYVVGVPRSGTTLVEQILASHGSVAAAGERNDVDGVVKRLVGDGPRIAALPQRAAHLAPAHRRREGERLIAALAGVGAQQEETGELCAVVDKQPLNYRYLGLLAELLPSARFLVCERDARDTALSCFFQNFARGLHWAFDLEDLGRYLRLARRFTEHWADVLPGRVLTLSYERLVRDPEPEVRRVLEFLELPWDPACLLFERQRRSVRTASAWQVREPLHTRAVGRSKPYAPHLGAMLRAFGEGGGGV